MKNIQLIRVQPPADAAGAVDLLRGGDFLLLHASASPLLVELESSEDGTRSILPLVRGQTLSFPGGFRSVRFRLDKEKADAWAKTPIQVFIGEGVEGYPVAPLETTIVRTIPHIDRSSSGSVHTFTEEPGTSAFYLSTENIPTIANKTICIALPNRHAVSRKVSILQGVSAARITSSQITKSIPLKSLFTLDLHDLCAVYVGHNPALTNARNTSRVALMRSAAARPFQSFNLGVSEEIYSPAAGTYKRGDAVLFEGGLPLFMTIDPDYTPDAALYLKIEETIRTSDLGLNLNAIPSDATATAAYRGEGSSWTVTI